MKKALIVLFVACFVFNLEAQEEEKKYIYQTFKSTHIVNAQSVETLQKRKLDIRIGHRFGDIAGSSGGWATLYGLESAADITIGAQYGITNNLTVALHRTKGAGDLKALINTTAKYKILSQVEGGMPLTMTLYAGQSYSTMKKGTDSTFLSSFPKYHHRFSYVAQLMFARKFGDRFSLQLTPGYIHRNLVNFDDENGMFTLGLASRIQMTKVLGLIIDATYPVSNLRMQKNSGFYMPLGFGLEIDTGGHVFQVNFTNTRGIMETDYIPYSTSNWLDGQFRLGFSISRLFNL